MADNKLKFLYVLITILILLVISNTSTRNYREVKKEMTPNQIKLAADDCRYNHKLESLFYVNRKGQIYKVLCAEIGGPVLD